MNLLKDEWIPVRPLQSGSSEKISMRRLLCGEEKWEVCLPRDDMELATIQLLICLAQTLFMPKTINELKQRIAKPMTGKDYEEAIKPPYADWFQLDNPKYPFMQVYGVMAKKITQIDKLMAGLSGSENCCFVNEPGLATQLCGGCAAIALFNQAACCPSFGGGNEGGFKPGLRGSSPITTLVQGPHLRQTVWLNVLCEDNLTLALSWHQETRVQKPTWVVPIKAGEAIAAERIGLMRGLFWQPAHVQLLPPKVDGQCSCCGFQAKETYDGFNKAQFGYKIAGIWPHPHSARVFDIEAKKVEKQPLREYRMTEKFISFRDRTPSWTHLGRFVVQQFTTDAKTPGQQPAPVIQQAPLIDERAKNLHILFGGYRNNQAKILERRHEVFTLNHGWDKCTNVIKDLVKMGLGYKDALGEALKVFVNGTKKVKGAGVKLHQVAEGQFYRQSEPTVLNSLARIDFNNPTTELTLMRKELRLIVEALFAETVRPYMHDPELIHAMAEAKKKLRTELKKLEPQQDKGGNNGATTT